MEEETTIQQDIARYLSECLVKAHKMKGIMIIVAYDTDEIWSYGAGDLITRLGLLKSAELKAAEMWNTARVLEDEE